ncbi:TolC family protein [Pseudoxanthomonas sp. SGD-10]|nr:TolC family protein [Pseudoxanthomonas sp. SGD-10]
MRNTKNKFGHVSARIRQVNLTLFLILSSCFTGFSQEILSLDEILNKIEDSNNELRAYDLQKASEQAKVDGAKTWMAPMVGGGTFMTPYPGQNSMDKGSLMFTLEQGLPNSRMNKAREKYLASLSAITEARKSMTFNELRALAKQNYYSLLVNEKRLKSTLESQTIMNNMKKLGEIRYEYNRGSLSQIYKAEGRIHEMQNMIDEIHNDIYIAKINLNVLMNRSPEIDFDIPVETSVQFKPVAALDSAFLANNISELKMAEREINSMKLDAEMIKNEANPEVKLRLDHMSPLSSGMPQQYSAMAMLSIPLAPWSAKSYKANLKANKLEVEAMEYKRSALINSMYGRIKSMERNIANIEKRVKNFEDNIIPAMQKNLDVLMLNYQENKESLLMVIDGWETLNKVQLDYANELDNYYKMVVDYEKSIER